MWKRLSDLLAACSPCSPTFVDDGFGPHTTAPLPQCGRRGVACARSNSDDHDPGEPRATSASSMAPSVSVRLRGMTAVSAGQALFRPSLTISPNPPERAYPQPAQPLDARIGRESGSECATATDTWPGRAAWATGVRRETPPSPGECGRARGRARPMTEQTSFPATPRISSASLSHVLRAASTTGRRRRARKAARWAGRAARPVGPVLNARRGPNLAQWLSDAAANLRGRHGRTTSSSRAARAPWRYASRRSNFAGVCRFCVGDTGDALAVRPRKRRMTCNPPS